jgi:hypothetical protein
VRPAPSTAAAGDAAPATPRRGRDGHRHERDTGDDLLPVRGGAGWDRRGASSMPGGATMRAPLRREARDGGARWPRRTGDTHPDAAVAPGDASPAAAPATAEPAVPSQAPTTGAATTSAPDTGTDATPSPAPDTATATAPPDAGAPVPTTATPAAPVGDQ